MSENGETFPRVEREVLPTRQVADALLNAGAVRFNFERGFTFTSGLRSPVYFDGSSLGAHQQAWRLVLRRLEQYAHDADVVAGVATSAIIHSAALASIVQKPHAFVRKEAKKYGTGSRISGAPVAEKRVLLIEDTVTTGGNMLKAVDTLRKARAHEVTCAAINTYGLEKARDAFSERGLLLHALTSIRDIIEAALERGIISRSEFQCVRAWLTHMNR